MSKHSSGDSSRIGRTRTSMEGRCSKPIELLFSSIWSVGYELLPASLRSMSLEGGSSILVGESNSGTRDILQATVVTNISVVPGIVVSGNRIDSDSASSSYFSLSLSRHVLPIVDRDHTNSEASESNLSEHLKHVKPASSAINTDSLSTSGRGTSTTEASELIAI